MTQYMWPELESGTPNLRCLWKGSFERHTQQGSPLMAMNVENCELRVYPTWFEHTELYLLGPSEETPESTQTTKTHYWDENTRLKVSSDEEATDSRFQLDVKAATHLPAKRIVAVCMPQHAPLNIFHTGKNNVTLFDKIENDVLVRCDQANIVVDKIRGKRVVLLSQQGEITIKSAVEGEIDIYARSVQFQRLLASTLSIVADENVEGAGLYAQTSALHTANGNVSLGSSHGDLGIEIGSGNIELLDARGRINAHIRDAGSIQACIEYPEGDNSLHAGRHAGDVNCRLSAFHGILADIDAKTVDIPNEFRDQLQCTDEEGRQQYQGTINVKAKKATQSKGAVGKIDQKEAASIPGNFVGEARQHTQGIPSLNCVAMSGNVSIHQATWKDLISERYYQKATKA